MSEPVKNAVEALKRLAEGNARFVKGRRSVDPAAIPATLKELAARGQKPFVAVLGCADSRVPVELVFDLGPGDAFVVRLAGNVAAEPAIASLEFAAAQLNTPLCLVLGHLSCGAVKAAIEAPESPPPTPHLAGLVREIRPAVSAARKNVPDAEPAELLKATVWENVRLQIAALRFRSPLLREAERSGKLIIAGAVKDLATGAVTFEDPAGVRDQGEKARV